MSSRPLTSSTPMLSRPDGRPLPAVQRPRHRRAHHGVLEQLLRIGADRRPDIEDHGLALQRRPDAGDRRAVDGMRRAGRTCAIAISAPVLPAETAKSARLLHRLDGAPHAGAPAPAPQRLTGLVVHAHRHLAVLEGGRRLHPRIAIEQRRHHRLVAEQAKTQFGEAAEHQIGAGDDHRRPLIAAHDIERCRDCCRHRIPAPLVGQC